MIRYDLGCANGHSFDAWFRDSAAFDAQAAADLVRCPVCGTPRVEKRPMAPAVRTGQAQPARANAPEPVAEPAGRKGLALSAPPDGALGRELAALRRRIEDNADYVGPRFAEEARRLHRTGEDDRAIWGEATAEEARSLIEDGLPVAPLPFLPRRND